MRYQPEQVEFSQLSVYRAALGKRLYEQALTMCGDDPAVLEIGPGNGDVVFEQVQSGMVPENRLFLCEPDPAAAAALAARFREATVSAKPLEQFLGETASQPFDLVLGNFSLHWVESISTWTAALCARLSANGVLALTNTDVTRSFWGAMDADVQDRFPGCSLFNVQETRVLSPDRWTELFEDCGLTLEKRIDYEGTAAHFASAEAMFADFKRVCGPRYLRLEDGATQEEVEEFVLASLHDVELPDGRTRFPASGFQLLFKNGTGRHA